MGCNTGFWQPEDAARSPTSSTGRQLVDEPRKRSYDLHPPSPSPIGPVRSIDCRV